MKTGIIRRVDNFGRITIPKTLRKKLNIQENDALEISITENSIILQKCNDVSKLKFAKG